MYQNCLEIFKKINLLIIEDDSITLEVLKKYLSRYFGMIYIQENGREGIEAFKEYKPDIIITDIYMPMLNGLEMVKSIKKDIEKDVPVVVITSFSDEDLLLEAIDIRINKFIKKPFQFPELLDALCQISKEYYSNRFSDIALNYGYRYDLEKNKLFLNSDEINLTKKESVLFNLLIRNRKQIISKELIEEYVWEDKIMTVDSLKALLRRLRKKIYPISIQNVPNRGYKLNYNKDNH